MVNKDFLLEIGCEELPTGSLLLLAEGLKNVITHELKEAELTHKEPQIFATPRRIAVMIPELASEQPSRVIDRQGPNADSAYDKSGTPTLACIGFARLS